MSWFYVYAGKQAGPVEDEQLASLVQAGHVQRDTLVWREGMADWQPYEQVIPTIQSAAPAAPPILGAPVLAANEAVCSECGRIFPVEEMIPYGAARICAGCKPAFVQKLSEGARVGFFAATNPSQPGAPTLSLPFAGFWVRFGAEFLDRVILGVVNVAINLIGTFAFFQTLTLPPGEALVLRGLLALIQLGIAFSYETILVAKYGATLGKMACKIKVIRADGEPITYGLACGRYFAKLLSCATLGIGFIVVAFDVEKRGLHDRLCNTRVVLA